MTKLVRILPACDNTHECDKLLAEGKAKYKSVVIVGITIDGEYDIQGTAHTAGDFLCYSSLLEREANISLYGE